MYKDLYYYLFNCITDAERMIEEGSYILALETLKAAQIQCEEKIMNSEED